MFPGHPPLPEVGTKPAHCQNTIVVSHIVPSFHHHRVTVIIKHGCKPSTTFPIFSIIVSVLPRISDIFKRGSNGQEFVHFEVVELISAKNQLV